MYSFGSLTTEPSGEMVRKGGILHTVKDGIVIENEKLMNEVEKMVRESKQGTKPTAMELPFIIK